MITELANTLYEVVTSLDVAIRHNITVDLDKNATDLKFYLEQYKNTPQLLYKEIFEPWCKVDVIRFSQLTNSLISKPDKWSEQSMLIIPDLWAIANTLCEIADEIETRLPNIKTEIEQLTTHTGDISKREKLICELEQPERIKKYFARAVEVGYMIPTDTGYKWLFGGAHGKARLGYFVVWVLCGELARAVPSEQRQIIEGLFNVTRLDSTLDQNFATGKSKKVKQWRAEIDKTIFFD